ncbi:hypothetical protein PR202_ga17951 [Eleusine coracana subsp. coracana]|uniref:KIB1-4 beta-propeller domain-containing protein n=1 Tax=Eleusine coracana subsp. coracana TaxID=191504 RepID=A0AAV5CS95_ELECO|nr:hypothetical protein PR202_ga17951 [Eleusine coracana subsp. coracana]
MDGGGWSSLPVDLLKEVSGRLSSDADYLRIHQVCPHWRAFTVPPAVYRPWLVAGRHGRSGLQLIGEYSLRLLRGDAPGTGVRDPPAGLPYCCGASWGCLALVDDDQNPTRLVLWEPLSNTEISLPCLRPITWIFLSDDPLTSADWIVIASQLQGVIGQRTLFWRPGDASWSILNGRGTSQIDTITFLDGKAYYIDIRRNIIVCDFNLGTDLFPKYTPIYHVCNVVNRICKCDRLHPSYHPSVAEIYKAVCTTNMRLELLERVYDLGEYAVFVGRGILEKIPYPEDLKGDPANWDGFYTFDISDALVPCIGVMAFDLSGSLFNRSQSVCSSLVTTTVGADRGELLQKLVAWWESRGSIAFGSASNHSEPGSRRGRLGRNVGSSQGASIPEEVVDRQVEEASDEINETPGEVAVDGETASGHLTQEEAEYTVTKLDARMI